MALGFLSRCPGLSPTPRPLLTVAEGTVSGVGTAQASTDPQQAPLGARHQGPGQPRDTQGDSSHSGVPGVQLQEAPNPGLTWPSAPPATSCWLSPSMKRLRRGEAGERERQTITHKGTGTV